MNNGKDRYFLKLLEIDIKETLNRSVKIVQQVLKESLHRSVTSHKSLQIVSFKRYFLSNFDYFKFFALTRLCETGFEKLSHVYVINYLKTFLTDEIIINVTRPVDSLSSLSDICVHTSLKR